MKKAEYLKSVRIDKLDNSTVFISNRYFNFSYTVANTVVKEEFMGKYRYFGGLQSEFNEGSEEYKNLEKWLCELAETVLSINK